MSIQISVKDLPQHGLKLISPTDPAFQGKLSTLRAGKGDPLLREGLTAYCVLLENNGKKAVAGYRLTWEMTKADGTVSVQQAGGVNAGALMVKGHMEREATEPASQFVIKPNSAAFVSLAGSLSEEVGGTINAYTGGAADRKTIEELREDAKHKESSSLQDTMIADLRNYKTITASIDGVFFEDGTFIGPDTTGLFASVELAFNARRDLLEEIAFAVERKRSQDQIFSDIEKIANVPLPNRKLDREDLYNLFKKMEAEGVLRLRSTMDGQKALDISLLEYRRAWPKLKKL